MTIAERFWGKVAEAPDGCWTWTGGVDSHGYGQFYVRHGEPIGAHRWAYMDLVGEIPNGLELDHLCRNRPCVNPGHLEPVPHHINMARGLAYVLAAAERRARTHCPQGHPYDAANTYITPLGKRDCRACRSAAGRRRRNRMEASR